MILILDLNKTIVHHFDNFDELLECIITLEDSKSASNDPDFSQRDWNFTVFPPNVVASLYANTEHPSVGLIEAYEEK